MGSYEQLAASSIEYSPLAHQDLNDALADYGPLFHGSYHGNDFRISFASEPNDNTETIVFDVNPYSVDIDDPSLMTRRKVAAEVLGPRYALVGVEVCNPKTLPLTRKQRHEVASGNFDVFSDRLLAAQLSIAERSKADFKHAFYGFSMGGDVSAEASLRSLTNKNRGEVQIDYLGVFDPARTKRRGRVSMANDFANSAPDLYEEVSASGVPSLFEARGINPEDPKAKQKHIREISLAVARLSALHPLHSLAMLNGFGTLKTTESLQQLVGMDGAPLTTIGRMGLSTICDQGLIETLALAPSARLYDENIQTFGYDPSLEIMHQPNVRPEFESYKARLTVFENFTHGAADNLAKNAGFVLRTVMR